MIITIELAPDIEAGLLARAQAEGTAVSEYLQNMLREQVSARNNTTPELLPPYELPLEEWIRDFARGVKVLSIPTSQF